MLLACDVPKYAEIHIYNDVSLFVRKTKPFLYCFIPKLPGGTMKAVNSASKEIKELGRRSSDEKKISLLEQPTNDRVWMFLGTFRTKVSHLHC